MRRALLCVFVCWSLVFVAPDLSACTTCRCGTVPSTTSGAVGPTSPGSIFGRVDWVHQRTSAGTAGVDRIEAVEDRLALALAAVVLPRWTVGISVPITSKRIELANAERQSGSGLGDITLASDVALVSTQTTRMSALAGLRIPSAPELTTQGEALNLDAQPGTGAFVPSVGVEYTGAFGLISPSLRAEVYLPLKGRFDVTPARAFLWSAGGSFQVHTALSLRVGADGRTEGPDEYVTGNDLNSGGTIMFMSTEIRARISRGVAVGTAVRVPAYSALRGTQAEGVIVGVGLSFQRPRAASAPALPTVALLH